MRKILFLCFVLLLMTLPTTARAQVTYDNAASSQCGVCSSLTYSLTVGSGSNRALAVWVFISDVYLTEAENPYVTGITYAGVSLIPIAIRSGTDLLDGRAELWALPAGTQPTSGVNNVVVTLNSTANMNSMHSGAISVAGVDQTQTFTSIQTNSIRGTYSAYMTLPLSGANDLVFDGVCGGHSVDSTTQTQRVLNNVDTSTTCNNDGIATAAGGTVYLSWAVNGSASSPGDQAFMVGGSFHAAATATKLQLKSGKLQVVANTGTSTPAPTFQWVQAQTGVDNGGGNDIFVQTSAFSSSTTTGDTIICTTTVNQLSNAISSVTDTQSNTYTKATSVQDSNQTQGLELWYVSNITGGSSFKVTATWASSTIAAKYLSCHEYAGLLPANALDQTWNGAPANVTTAEFGPVTTLHDRELVFYYFFSASNGGVFCGWNDNFRAHTYLYSSVCDFIQYTAGQVQANAFQFGTGGPISAVLATFRLNDASLQVK
jgi:hypothetical protein